MTDLTKIAGSEERSSRSAFGEIIAMAAIVVLLVAVQGMFIAKHATTLNDAAKPAAIGVMGP